MHEVLLYASIPQFHHSHILKILSGISAMQPLPINEHHLIFKPTRTTASLPTGVAGRPVAGGKPGAPKPAATQAAVSNDLFFLRMVGDLSQTTEGSSAEGQKDSNDTVNAVPSSTTEPQPETDIIMSDADTTAHPATTYPFHQHPWTLLFQNLPDVQAKRPATSRLISEIPLEYGNPRSFVEGMGYTYLTSYVVRGERFTHDSLTLRLFRCFPLQNPLPTVGEGNPIPLVPQDDTFGGGEGSLDPTGAYVLEVSVRVRDGSKPELMDEAYKELGKFRDLMKGIVALEPVERMSLDTRVRAGGGGQGGRLGAVRA